MDFQQVMSLVVVLVVLAALPSASVLLVIARSTANGFRHGVAVSSGIVCADLLFATLALVGMSVVAELLGELFVFVKYVGGLYLMWFGWFLIRRGPAEADPIASSSSVLGDFVAGFLLTLGDAKAIFFYASLFPAFVDLGHATIGQFAAVLLLTAIAVGVPKLAYAKLASSAVLFSSFSRYRVRIRQVAGIGVLGTGALVIVKAP